MPHTPEREDGQSTDACQILADGLGCLADGRARMSQLGEACDAASGREKN